MTKDFCFFPVRWCCVVVVYFEVFVLLPVSFDSMQAPAFWACDVVVERLWLVGLLLEETDACT